MASRSSAVRMLAASGTTGGLGGAGAHKRAEVVDLPKEVIDLVREADLLRRGAPPHEDRMLGPVKVVYHYLAFRADKARLPGELGGVAGGDEAAGRAGVDELGVHKAVDSSLIARRAAGDLGRAGQKVLQPAGAVDARVEQHPALARVGHIVVSRGDAPSHIVFEGALHAHDLADGARVHEGAHALVARGKARLQGLHEKDAARPRRLRDLPHLAGVEHGGLLAEDRLALGDGAHRPRVVQAMGEGEVDGVDVIAGKKRFMRGPRLVTEGLVGERVCAIHVKRRSKSGGFGGAPAAQGNKARVGHVRQARGEAVRDAPGAEDAPTDGLLWCGHGMLLLVGLPACARPGASASARTVAAQR